MFNTDNNKTVGDGGDRNNETIVNLSRNLIYIPNIEARKKSTFPTPNCKKVFNPWK